jgi:hypothetical protein
VSGLPPCGTFTVRSTPMQASIPSEDPGIQAVASLATEVVETRSLEIRMASGCTHATGLFPAVNIFLEAQAELEDLRSPACLLWRVEGTKSVPFFPGIKARWRDLFQQLSG